MNTESKKILDDAEAKREIIKRIKEKKLFSKFYSACAEAFHRNLSPRDSLNCYFKRTVRYYWDYDRIDEFVNGIKTWTAIEREVLIMP